MILRPVRTSQPQGPARIDWSNPNAEGLLGSWVGSGRGKAAFGTDAIPQGNAVAKIGQAGVGLSNTNTGSNNFWKVERGTTYTYTQQVTFEALIEVDVFTNVAPFISGVIAQYVQPGSSADDRGPFLRFGNGSSENRDKPFFAVIQNNSEKGVLGPSLQTGRKYHLLGTYDGATVKLFIDGVLIGTNATTGSFENGANAYVAIGTDYPGTSSSEFRALQGRIYLANVYGTGKTDAQAKSLAANPWQTFAPESKSLWVPETVSAGGGATTGTLAATESGADTAVISGQVIVQGTLAATETGQDTAALAGQVIITGVLAAAEIGSDTAVINGSASVTTTGTLAATESGSDMASLTGRVLVQGALSVTESGSDAAAIAGQVLVQGTLAAAEQGSDTALINGSSVITTTGTLNATEQGGDTAAMTGQVLVQALIDAAEQGADTAQLVGQIVVTGVLAAVEVGWDTAAFLQSDAPPPPIATEPNESAYYQRVAAAILAGKVSGPHDALFLRLARRRSNGY